MGKRRGDSLDPAQPIKLNFSSVWIEASRKTAMAETATKTAVHVPWREMAFRAILCEGSR